MVDLGETTPWRRTTLFPEYQDRSLLEVFRGLAAACPDRVGVRDGARSLSYRELHDSIDAVAHGLRSRRPAGHVETSDPPWVVTAVVGHGIDALLTVYGVMAAGAVLVPIDEAEPVDRMALIHREGGAQLALCSAAQAGRVRTAIECRVEPVDELLRSASRRTGSPADAGPAPHALAMVNFTSGTTGTPKGVVRDHATLVRAGFTTAESNGIEIDDRVAFTGSFSFIGAYARSLGAFVAGAELCIHDPGAGGSRELAQWILDRRISVLQFIPSRFRHFTDATLGSQLHRMESVKIVSLGGEATYGRDIARAQPLFGPSTRFVNRYGSSETSILAEWVVTPEDVARADEPVPLGRPLPWADIVVVDDAGERVAEGEVGVPDAVSEHCSLGYWNDPVLTAAKFWTLPDGRRGFHMSDHVRVRHDSVLEYVARADDRVKVRGLMVSPGEVERALTALEGVHDAAVVPAAARDGGTRLVGYVAPVAGAELRASEVRRALTTSLPSAMVPGTIVFLDAFPLTPRGKVDRHALPPPPSPRAPAYRDPAGNEATLARCFARVLGVERVGLDDDFFELGGDSLDVVELLAEIADRFAVDVPASAVMEAPTVAQLFTRLSHRRRRKASPVVPLRADASGPTLFCVTGGGSPAISLRQLSEALAGRNVAAIQARGLEERARADRTVEAAARRNVTAIRVLQPRGPYTLAGFSYGGLVAFAMACRLRAAGEDVASLVILDTPAPVGARSRRHRAARPSAPRALRATMASAYASTKHGIALASAGLVPRRGYRQYELFWDLNLRMSQRYAPASRFDGSVLVVRSDEPPHTAADLGWSELVSGPVTSVHVPAEHLRLLRAPAVDLVAAHIVAALETSSTERPG
jgi:acyl-coenzyme A synthetase/AMP-(fatty) acid ligase/thioesterase domain-containing protein/acyl carrier protein